MARGLWEKISERSAVLSVRIQEEAVEVYLPLST